MELYLVRINIEIFDWLIWWYYDLGLVKSTRRLIDLCPVKIVSSFFCQQIVFVRNMELVVFGN